MVPGDYCFYVYCKFIVKMFISTEKKKNHKSMTYSIKQIIHY